MSREPTSTSMQASQVLGGWSNAVHDPEPPAPEPTQPPRRAQRKRKFRVVVEPAKPKPKPAKPTRGYYERAVSKWTTTTEALTAEERQIISGYRLSVGGDAAEAERRRIEQEVRR